jgi:outer membrane PBP1 activator LpoA protein
MPSRRDLVRALVWGSVSAPLSALAQSAANAPPQTESADSPARVRFGEGGTTVALLLPRQDGPFGRASSSLLAGVRAAHARDGSGIVVEVLELDDQADELALALAGLRERGAAFVIGPVTRNGVTALADLGSLGIPTLALNLPEGSPVTPAQLAFFGLAIETEVRQVIDFAFEGAVARIGSGRPPRAAVVSVATPLGRRAAQAFRAGWTARGGQVAEPIEFSGPRPSGELRARLAAWAPDVAFLAMNAEQSAVLRRAFPAQTTVWATSLASIGNVAGLRLPELDGMRVLEMPWLAEPDNVAVMAYPKAPSGFNVEMQRLYALGIDAFRIARQMLAGDAAFELDGVTGRLRFDRQQAPRVERTALQTEYRDGTPRLLAQP